MVNEALVKKYMDKYHISRAESLEMIAYDEETDKMTVGQINKSMTKEEREAVKAMSRGSSEKKKTTVYKFDKKERPKDEEKVKIIAELHEFLAKITENAEIVNPAQEISFKIGENDYSIKLTKHRNSKK